MNPVLEQKLAQLRTHVNTFDTAVVAYSGGVDSALMLKVAHDCLGDRAVGVTADSPSLPRRELEEAKKTALQIGARHVIIQTSEVESADYLKNPANRCYFCKSELYSKLQSISAQLGAKTLLNGTNLDDVGDYRPGLAAANEFQVISPLKDAKLTKQDVRDLALHFGLPVWDKPSSPCLSSRVPYLQEITLQKLSAIESAENYLKDLGFRELRVRHFGSTAKIELSPSDQARLASHLESVRQRFLEIGFNEVTIIDFKSGNLNEFIRQPSV